MHPDVDFPLAANRMTFNSFVSTYTLAHPGLRSLGNTMYDNRCTDLSLLTWLMCSTPQGTILGPLVFNPFYVSIQTLTYLCAVTFRSSEHLHTLQGEKLYLFLNLAKQFTFVFSLSLLLIFDTLNCLTSSQQLLANTGCRCKHDTGPHAAKFENHCCPSAHLTVKLSANGFITSIVI